MAKQPQKHPIYGFLNREGSNPHLNQGVTIDKQGKIFRWVGANPIVSTGVERVYKNWEEFNTWAETPGNGLAKLEEIHSELFGHPIPAKANIVTTSVAIYSKWCVMAEDRTTAPGSNSAPKDPVTGRKSTIGTRIYTVLWDGKSAYALKTPQATACLKIITEEARPTKVEVKDPTTGLDNWVEVPQITEAALKEAVVRRQAELRTRQDPWRIFQYYRPQLIQAKLIKHN